MIQHLKQQLMLLAIAMIVTLGVWPAHAGMDPREPTATIILNADQIDALTRGMTWVIEVKGEEGATSSTYFREDGVRFSWRGVGVEKLGWVINEENQRCVFDDSFHRCGWIADINGELTICMQLDPIGDCSFRVTERLEGDALNLEQLWVASNPS